MIRSDFTDIGNVQFPMFSGIRVLMMPICLDDIGHSLPEQLRQWTDVVRAMRGVGNWEGISYLTIDELDVPDGCHHRRPGLHVDGWHSDGVWGGGTWGSGGWLTVSSHIGCAAWRQTFDGEPSEYGDCSHFMSQCKPDARELLRPQRIYWLSPFAVHETLPVHGNTRRQFVRLSLPSACGWPISCTSNPRGIAPNGPLLPPRPTIFTNYRPH